MGKLSWLEPLQKIVEISALFIGAVWALYNFNLKDRPSLVPRENVSSTLKWEHRSQDTINAHAEFYVTLENTGTSAFDIKKAKVYVIQFDEIGPGSAREVRLFDIDWIKRKGDTIFTDSFVKRAGTPAQTNPPFIGKYDPGMVWSDNLEFLMKNDPKKMVAFYIEFYKDCDTKPFDWTYHWEYIGGIDTSKTGSRKN